ncbi:MAG: hypothetical protein HDT15_00360 [Oscillibacter sp.]|nr:hypothetical protein [Oscillibacter sp.]
MFTLYVDKNKLTLRQRETVTSGSANVYPVRFEFSADWDGMKRTAVFRAGEESRSVLLDGSGECSIPWEMLEDPGIRLYAGVYGTRDGDVVLPTVWTDLGMILTGAAPGEDARLPTPELWQQELDRKQDVLRGLPGQVVGFNEEGKAAAVDMGSVEEGTLCQFGHGLKRSGNVISVDTADGFDGDKTLPITAAAVETAVGNIEILLETI